MITVKKDPAIQVSFCGLTTYTELYVFFLQLYKRSGSRERAVSVLEAYVKSHVNNADLSVVVLLVSLLMETNQNAKALEHIEHAQQAFCAREQIPLDLTIKAGICHLHLGDLEKAEVCIRLMSLFIFQL